MPSAGYSMVFDGRTVGSVHRGLPHLHGAEFGIVRRGVRQQDVDALAGDHGATGSVNLWGWWEVGGYAGGMADHGLVTETQLDLDAVLAVGWADPGDFSPE
ncbi:hypothetical protein GCM10009780_03930 [Actinomadura alba]